MSLAERLFPTSELEALRKYTYGEDASDRRPAKRLRLNSTCSTLSVASSAVDSGYNSEDGGSQMADVAAVTRKRQRVNSEPTLSSRAPADSTPKRLTCIQASDRQNSTKSNACRSPAASFSTRTRDADLEIVSAQHRIALARQRLHSYSGPVHATHHDQTDLGCTAGPKAARSLSLFTRLFDGCRIMKHERNLLDALFDSPEDVIEPKPAPQIDLTAEEKKEVEEEVNFVGFAMPASLEDDELDYVPGAYCDEPAVDSGFEDFFNLDEASTPGEEGIA